MMIFVTIFKIKLSSFIIILTETLQDKNLHRTIKSINISQRTTVMSSTFLFTINSSWTAEKFYAITSIFFFFFASDQDNI